MSLRRPGGFLVGGGWQLLADPARQATRSAGNRAWPWAWSGMDGGQQASATSPLLGLVGSVGASGAVGLAALVALLAVLVAALGAAGALAGQPGGHAGRGG
jgi:hypothetical protein